MPDPEVSKRFVVHGRVQGVGFRDSVCRFAWKLGGLKGHVRNTRDGRVEVCVTAPAQQDRRAARVFCGRARRSRGSIGWTSIRSIPRLPPGPFCIVFGG